MNFNRFLIFLLALICATPTLAAGSGRGLQLSQGPVQAGEFYECKNNQCVNLSKEVCAPITIAADTAEHATNAIIPANAVVQDAYINVITAEATGATKTLSVGTLSSESQGNATGFITGLSVASTGRKVPNPQNSALTLGSLLRAASPGEAINYSFVFDLANLGNITEISFTPGYNGRILGAQMSTLIAATTASKSTTLTLNANGSPVTGGVLSPTSANMTPISNTITATAVTGANTFTNAQTVSLVGSATTAFVEGRAVINILLQNDDNTVFNKLPYATNIKHTISYTLGSNDWANFVGDVCVVYTDPYH